MHGARIAGGRRLVQGRKPDPGRSNFEEAEARFGVDWAFYNWQVFIRTARGELQRLTGPGLQPG